MTKGRELPHQLPLARERAAKRGGRPKRVTVPFVPGSKLELYPHELFLINTPTFQRLFLMKQLGTAYLVYPGATHTRAEHSLHALAIAAEMIEGLERHGFDDPISDYEKRIRVAVLLHDITQVPFGHTLEDEVGALEEHDKSEDRIGRVFNALQTEIVEAPDYPDYCIDRPTARERTALLSLVAYARKTIRTIHFLETLAGDDQAAEAEARRIEPKEIEAGNALSLDEAFVADIVGNTISADLLAYLKLDLQRTGLGIDVGWAGIMDSLVLAPQYGEPKRRRLAIKITKNGLRNDVVSEIFDILQARFNLTDRVYYHHAKCAADAMLGKLFQVCGITRDSDFELALERIGDEGAFNLVAQRISKLESDAVTNRSSTGQGSRNSLEITAKRLYDGLRSRRLFKRIFVATASEPGVSVDPDQYAHLADPVERSRLERTIEEQCSLPPGSVIAFCPKPDKQLKEASVMIVYDRRGGECSEAEPLRMLHEAGPFLNSVRVRVRAQEELYRDIWRLVVFFDPEFARTAPFIERAVRKTLELRNSALFRNALNDQTWYVRSVPVLELTEQEEVAEPGLLAYVPRVLNAALESKGGKLDPRVIVDQARQLKREDARVSGGE